MADTVQCVMCPLWTWPVCGIVRLALIRYVPLTPSMDRDPDEQRVVSETGDSSAS